MKNKTVLISGAGVAGLTLAYWLKRFGFIPTIVEKHPSLRTGGYKIDLRGAGLEVIKRMGVYPAISESRTKITRAICVDETGQQVTEMSADLCGTRVEGVDLEIMRSTLCHILWDAMGEVECFFDDSITKISETVEGVQVKFEKNGSRHYDLVVGADGLHSTVRKLFFGEEAQFSREMGVYVSIFTFPNFLKLSDCEIEHHSLRRYVNLYRDRKNPYTTAAIAFSTPEPFNSHDPKEQQELILKTFADSKWEMPRILASMKDSPEFYFDVMAQIHMPSWSKARVALVGDAGYSVTPLAGQGTSVAIAGAYVLAGELFKAQGDPQIAFARYEALMRPFVKKNQKLAHMSANIMRGSAYSIWLHRIGALMPGKLILFFKNLGLKRTTKAANALYLKDYEKDR